MTPTADSVAKGRWFVLAAAMLWSLSGLFVKLLTRHTALGLGDPPVEGLIIAFYRTLFAGLFLSLFVRRVDVRFRPLMLLMMLSFATMNALFVSALDLGTAANAIILQYTAPVWLYLAGVWWLGEPADRRGTIALVIAMSGVAVIVVAGWQGESLDVVLIALGSGFAYAGVLLCLRILRSESSAWLTVQNHLAAALVLLPVVFFKATPAIPQLAVLLLFGTVQMGFPYWLASRGLRTISSAEAGTICLLEPLLNPLWVYLAVREVPDEATFYGGGLILAALAYRYWPTRRSPASRAACAAG